MHRLLRVSSIINNEQPKSSSSTTPRYFRLDVEIESRDGRDLAISATARTLLLLLCCVYDMLNKCTMVSRWCIHGFLGEGGSERGSTMHFDTNTWMCFSKSGSHFNHYRSFPPQSVLQQKLVFTAIYKFTSLFWTKSLA